MKIAVITGEESGDKLAASILRKLKNSTDNSIDLYGIGGKALDEIGIQKFHDISEINVMGIFEVLPKILQISKIINNTVEKIIDLKPDLIFSVDSPDFTLRICKKIKNINKELKIIHMVAPSVWAWRAGRIKVVRDSVDHLLTILPFEKEIFDKENIKTTYVGHPITEIETTEYKNSDNEISNLNNDKETFLILPGSRKSEVTKLLPIYLKAVKKLNLNKNYKLVLPTTNNMKNIIIDKLRDFPNIEIEVISSNKDKYAAFLRANIAIVTSGTAALELSYFNVAYITSYKFNPLTYFILQFLIKSKVGNLINIINQKKIIPELLQSDCNPEKLSEFIEKYLFDLDERNKILEFSNIAINKLKSDKSPTSIASNQIKAVLSG